MCFALFSSGISSKLNHSNKSMDERRIIMRILIVFCILVIACASFPTLKAADETNKANGKSADIVAYVITETLNMTADANISSATIGKPLKYQRQCIEDWKLLIDRMISD
jgi:hypothetical protein